MKFTEEDQIITAEEAKKRSAVGQEDSLIRESIREIMSEIKQRSYYGYRAITHWVRLREDKEFETIKKEVKKLGFKIKLTDTEKTATPNRFNYVVNIEW